MKKLIVVIIIIVLLATITASAMHSSLLCRVKCVNWRYSRMQMTAMLCNYDPACIDASQGVIDDGYDACVGRCE